jgi:hypothetical protein
MTTTEQTTDTGLWGNPQKRADELKAGDMILVDGDPIEITHVQPVPDLGDGRGPRALVVYADATVTTWKADVMAVLATAEQIDAMRAAVKRAEKIANFRAFIDWLEDHPDVDLPYQLSAQGGLSGLPYGEQVARAEAFAKVHGAEVQQYTLNGLDVVTVDVRIGEYAQYSLYGNTKAVEPALRGTENGDPGAVVPPTVEGHGHERGQDWRDDEPAELPLLVEPRPMVDPALADRDEADCDDPWHLDTGEFAPTAPCGACGAVAEPTVGV